MTSKTNTDQLTISRRELGELLRDSTREAKLFAAGEVGALRERVERIEDALRAVAETLDGPTGAELGGL
jgi:hypothetical protein